MVDLRDLERINEMELLKILLDAIPKRVGLPLILNSLREILHISHETITRWMKILENIYIGYSLLPYGSEKIRAIKKERKFYLWDWSKCPDTGKKFENLVASHLLKFCHLMEDWEGYNMELRYIRNREGKEIDFVVLKERKPLVAVECKVNKTMIDPSVKYFKERLHEIPQFYQVHLSDNDYIVDERIRVLPFNKFCLEKQLP